MKKITINEFKTGMKMLKENAEFKAMSAKIFAFKSNLDRLIPEAQKAELNAMGTILSIDNFCKQRDYPLDIDELLFGLNKLGHLIDEIAEIGQIVHSRLVDFEPVIEAHSQKVSGEILTLVQQLKSETEQITNIDSNFIDFVRDNNSKEVKFTYAELETQATNHKIKLAQEAINAVVDLNAENESKYISRVEELFNYIKDENKIDFRQVGKHILKLRIEFCKWNKAKGGEIFECSEVKQKIENVISKFGEAVLWAEKMGEAGDELFYILENLKETNHKIKLLVKGEEQKKESAEFYWKDLENDCEEQKDAEK